jgi:transposase
MPGCGPLSAAKILGEVAGGARFRSKAAFARWNGTRPHSGVVAQRHSDIG